MREMAAWHKNSADFELKMLPHLSSQVQQVH